jgi:ABC-type multidrug transport system permease subunit
LIWIYAEKISNKIIDVKYIANKDDTINGKNIIPIGIIIFGLYIIMKYTPLIFTNISSYIIFLLKINNSNNKYSELIAGSIVNIMSLIVDIILVYIFIKYGQKIYKQEIDDKNANK